MVTLCRCAQVSRVSLCSQGVCVCVRDCICLSVCFTCVYVVHPRKNLTLIVCFFLPALSPGMFSRWTAATGNESTSLTFRGTSRWVNGASFPFTPHSSSVIALDQGVDANTEGWVGCFCCRAEWWRTSQSDAGGSLGSWVCGAAWAWVIAPWGETATSYKPYV